MKEYQVTEIPPANSMIGKHEDSVGTETYFSLEIREVPERTNALVAAPINTGDIDRKDVDSDGNIRLLSEETRAYMRRRWVYPPVVMHYLLFNGKIVDIRHEAVK